MIGRSPIGRHPIGRRGADSAAAHAEESARQDTILDESDYALDGSRDAFPVELSGTVNLPPPIVEGTIEISDPFPFSQIYINSFDWTGLPRPVSSGQLTAIRDAAQSLRIVIVQSDCDAQTRDNALKRVDAVVTLLEAPDAPWKQMVELLNSPHLSAFLMVTNLIQLIIALAS